MNKMIFKVAAFCFAIIVANSLQAQDLVILHTNDTHSQIEPLASGRSAGKGGFLRRSAFIDSVRSVHENVLLLDAGDYNQGTPYFTLFKGDAEVMLYNAMGYDATALGNHEFDNGEAELARRLSKANYVTLCANYNFKKSPLKNLVEPYKIFYKGGKKIAVIGLLINLDGYVSQRSRAGIKYSNPIPVANKLAKRLKHKEGCDLVICLTHLGFNEGSAKYPSDCDLAASSKDIDIIIGGHSHTFLKNPEKIKNLNGKDVIVTQMGAHGVYVGKIDIYF